MASKVKKLFIVGTLVTGLFMSISACDQNTTSNVTNSSSDIALSSNQDNSNSGSSNGENFSSPSSSSSQPVVLTGITAVSSKEAYEWGEDLSVTLYANYSDGSSVEVTDYQVSGYNSSISGEQTVVYTYEGQTTSIKVKVNDPIIINLEVVNNKAEYEVGDALDITVTATYSDNSVVTITDYTVEGYDSQKAGEQNITVSYGSKSTSVKVKVNELKVVSISATSAKDAYEWGEDLVITVDATYSNNTTSEVTGYTVSGYNKEVSGEQTVTVTYEGQTYTFKVTVNNPVLVSITAVSNKETYEQGDALKITVFGTYSDGSQVELTGYTVDGYNNQQVGEQTLTISFEGKECSLKVSVKERISQFPKTKLEEYLQIEGIQTEVIAPVASSQWFDSVEVEQDGSKYFICTTNDEGTVGVDSLADQYSVLLTANNWKVEKENDSYTATKDQGDVLLTFATKNNTFSFRAESYCEFPDKVLEGKIITSKNDLKSGNKIIIGSTAAEFVVNTLEDGSFNTSYCVCSENGPATIAKNVVRFTLGQSEDGWTLTDGAGRKLGAKGLGELAWDEGSTGWTIVFSKSSVVIMNAERGFGRLCYNPDTGKITTYKSLTGTNLIYPEIFSLNEKSLIYPTSISLSGKDEISLGRSATMSLEYYPSDANSLSDVVWTSSDESVATVRNGVVNAVSVGEATITAKTKSKNSYLESSFTVDVKEQVLDSWTIMLYLCGADLESGSGFATSDLNEILSVNGQPEDVNFIVQTGGSRSWRFSGISSSKLGRYHVENKQLVLDAQLPNASMGSQDTFESFLNWGLQEYPAENTGVIFWNHGGALDGCCYDENYGDDRLYNSETKAAFQNVFTNNGINKLEFVGYDACLMQFQDIAEYNSHYFNYMVASEEAEAGEGWVYNAWLDDVYADKSIDTILKANCDSFVNQYGDDQTLSYLNLSKMSDYYTKFEAMASAIKSTVNSNKTTFKNVLKSAKDFGDINYYWYQYNGYDSYGTVDAMDFLNKLGANSTFSSFSSEINAVKSVYNQLVVYSRKGSAAGNANGLGLITPEYSGYGASETAFNNWRTLL